MDKLEIAIVTDVAIGKDYDDRVKLVIYSKFVDRELHYTMWDKEILDFIIQNRIENLTDIIGRPIVYRSENCKWFFEKFFDE